MIPEFLQPIHLGERLAKLSRLGDKRIVDSKLSAISILRVSEGAKAHLAYTIPATKLYITSDQLQAKAVTKKLNSYEKGCAIYLPHKDDSLFYRGGTSKIVERERLSALTSYLSGKHKILVVSADGLVQKFSKPNLFDKFTSKVHIEDFIAPSTLADNLAKAGYTRVDAVAEIGDFALRGDILDVYSLTFVGTLKPRLTKKNVCNHLFLRRYIVLTSFGAYFTPDNRDPRHRQET